jgi:hypothetical protein
VSAASRLVSTLLFPGAAATPPVVMEWKQRTLLFGAFEPAPKSVDMSVDAADTSDRATY